MHRIFSLIFLTALPSFTFADDRIPDFNRDVRPLLSDRCISCHGPDANPRESALRLDESESATEDRGGYSVVVPGNADASELMKRITSNEPDSVMPPPHLGKTLTKDQVDILRRWIDSGAEFKPHWAFVKPEPHPTPKPKRTDWPINWIDNFILARLESEGVTPSPDANPSTLIRRLYLDLTGLPPSGAEAAHYVNDPSPANYERTIDRLLATDAHAEHLTAYWLDLVRFADTVGYHGDQDHNITPYRDWVIDAFADNMPFDQFTREQLAGDLLDSPTVDQKIATGYNRLLQTTHEGGLQPKEYLAIYAADRVRNVSVVWMGATVGCAQCHDHKYDPYTAKDFYSLAAFFADVDEAKHFKVGTNSLPTKRPPEITVHSRREREQLAKLESELRSTKKKARSVELKKQIESLKKSARRTMITVSAKPRTMRLLPRGNWLDDSGPIVEPSWPEFQTVDQAMPDESNQGTSGPNSNVRHGLTYAGRRTRLDLANWFTDVENGNGLLTARVFANRFWYLMFGRGLSRSLDDFGGQGFAPDHPELLDRLAIAFAKNDWNIRKLIKLIVMSRTYRQSSAWTDELRTNDPTNSLFARQSSFRLPAECVRDSVLAISGLLDRPVGGPGVKPPQPSGYYRHL
ncbi:MAG: PSD1 and planctomycete cytochrome C domain-containing protein, partial [Planctomycetaceae bacterium]